MAPCAALRGIDLARSRIGFARAWADDERAADLTFEAADGFALELEPASLGALLCITGAFAYFEPLAPGAGARLLAGWQDALAPGRFAVPRALSAPREVELLQATGGRARTWKELDVEDPWRFYLSALASGHGHSNPHPR